MYFRRTKKQQTKDQKNNILDGVFWAIMFYIITLFLVPYALQFGATPLQIGLLESLPLFVGALFGLFSYSVLKYFKSKKQLVVMFTIFDAFFCLLFGLVYFFVNQNIVWLLIMLFTFFNILNIVAGTVYRDWIGHVFVLRRIGTYTAQKHAILQLISIVPLLVSGVFLDKMLVSQNILVGFTIIFSVACVARLIATHFLNKISQTEDKEDLQKEIKQHKISLIKVIKKDVLDNKEYKFFLIAIFVLFFSVYMASPYFKYYFLETLNLNYFTYVSLHVITVISTVFSLKYWGKINDKYGSANILKATVFFIPFYTLLLVVFYKSIFLLCLLNFFDGMVVGGFIIALRTYFYQNTKKDVITHFALFTIVQSTGIILGTFFGAFIIYRATSFFTSNLYVMWTVFVVASAFRFIAVVYVYSIKNKYHTHETKINLEKEMLYFVPVRTGFSRFSRFIMHYEKNVADKIKENFNKNKKILKNK